MAGKPVDREGFSLRRWSQRKLDAARPREADNAAPRSSDALTAVAPPPVADAAGTDPTAAPLAPASEMPPAAAPVVAAPTELPSLDSLTIDSDYSPESTLARIRHVFAPRWPVPDAVLRTIVGDYFVNGVAARTLRHMGDVAAASATQAQAVRPRRP